eukprot:TRINITY_DN32215_c0_g1_i1.p2 TRINITY_DN32215_c0_g1~~TRINITY_DN32215_c0_g1_i1.p2  ORF type:complete len:129 (-),score=29.96 TRINITY_DN32215_c0_g1_i1:215-601(-)
MGCVCASRAPPPQAVVGTWISSDIALKLKVDTACFRESFLELNLEDGNVLGIQMQQEPVVRCSISAKGWVSFVCLNGDKAHLVDMPCIDWNDNKMTMGCKGCMSELSYSTQGDRLIVAGHILRRKPKK